MDSKELNFIKEYDPINSHSMGSKYMALAPSENNEEVARLNTCMCFEYVSLQTMSDGPFNPKQIFIASTNPVQPAFKSYVEIVGLKENEDAIRGAFPGKDKRGDSVTETRF